MDSAFPNIVTCLLDFSSHSWNWEPIKSVLWSVDFVRIVAFFIGGSNCPHKVVWHYYSNELFQVRSCYNIIFGLSVPDVSSFECVSHCQGSWISQFNWDALSRRDLPPIDLVVYVPFLVNGIISYRSCTISLFASGVFIVRKLYLMLSMSKNLA